MLLDAEGGVLVGEDSALSGFAGEGVRCELLGMEVEDEVVSGVLDQAFVVGEVDEGERGLRLLGEIYGLLLLVLEGEGDVQDSVVFELGEEFVVNPLVDGRRGSGCEFVPHLERKIVVCY